MKRIAIGLNLALVVLLVAGFIYYGNPGEIVAILATAKWSWFTLAVLAGLASSLASSARMWILLRIQGIEIGLAELCAINIGVRFYSFFSPLSSLGSVMRWIRLIPPGKSVEGLAALAANRFFETGVPLAMGAFWGLTSLGLTQINPWIFPAYLLVIVGVVWATLHYAEEAARRVGALQLRAAYPPAAKFLSALQALLNSLSRYRALSTRRIAVLVAIAMLSDIIGLLGHILVARSIDLPIAFTDIGWIRAIMLLVSLAPFTLPGGFGLREVSTIVLVSALGVEVGLATAYSLLLYSRLVVTALIGGFVELVVNLRTFRAGFSP